MKFKKKPVVDANERIYVADLTGALLDYWVARAEGETKADYNGDDEIMICNCPRYSTDWAQCGPIIEREGIWFEKSNWSTEPPVFAYIGLAHDTCGQFGDTRLIAAMRAYVASKFSDTVPPIQADRV
jgi:hypothetical protein